MPRIRSIFKQEVPEAGVPFTKIMHGAELWADQFPLHTGGIWHVSSPISIKPNIFSWNYHIKLRCKKAVTFSFFVATGITARGEKKTQNTKIKQLLQLKVQEWHLVASSETSGILCENILKPSIRFFLHCFYARDPTPNFVSLPPTHFKKILQAECLFFRFALLLLVSVIAASFYFQ